MARTAFRSSSGKAMLCTFVLLLVLGDILPGLEPSQSKHGMVVTATPEAAQAGMSMLQMGGNAIDAAAAAAFALMVTDPAMCSLGGRSQILINLKNGSFIGIDGATQTPGQVGEPARIGRGYGTIPIPGSPAALEEMVTRFGSLPLRVILQPSIELARDGFTIKQDYHDAFRQYGKYFRHYPGTVRHFLKADSSWYSEGDLLRQPALARTLEMIADSGTGILYRGQLADAMVDDINANGGLIREEDLAQYRPVTRSVVEGSFRGFRIISRGDQCDGASVIEMLQILQHFDLSRYALNDPQYIHLLAQVIYIGRADENLPDWQQVSPELAARRVRELDETKVLPMSVKPKPPEEEGETNHISVVDSAGNTAAVTQSIGPTFGSKVANPELGFFYAYSYDMNEDPLPFQREKTSQSPTMLLRDGKPFLVLGSAGSGRIPASIVQVIVNVIDHSMSLDEAVAAPRLFVANGELRLETMGRKKRTLRDLKELGYVIKTYEDRDGYFGKVQAVLIDAQSQTFYGTSDPRDNGTALGY